MQSTPLQLSGYLLRWPGGMAPIRLDKLVSKITVGVRIEGSHYFQHAFESAISLRHELTEPPHEYPLIVRYANPYILILSYNKEIVTYVREHLFHGSFSAPPQSLHISVDRLVRTIKESTSDYFLDFAYAKVDSFGDLLRWMSFYGTDLLATKLVNDLLPRMRFVTCGIRAADQPEKSVMRIGNDGFISKLVNNAESLDQAEALFRFLIAGGYIESPDGS